jgi:hypothetical protein
MLSPYQVQERTAGSAQARDVMPAGAGVLRRRAGIIIECPKPIHGPIAAINAIDEVSARNSSPDRRNIVKRPWVRVEQGIRKTMRAPSFLVCQRHESREDWAREAGAANAIFIIVVAIGEGLRLANKQPSLWITERRDIAAPRVHCSSVHTSTGTKASERVG